MRSLIIAVSLMFSFAVSQSYAASSVDLSCVRANMGRCLLNFTRPQCKRLLANACIQKPNWSRKCVKQNAKRCWYSMLTRRECVRLLRPVCKK